MNTVVIVRFEIIAKATAEGLAAAKGSKSDMSTRGGSRVRKVERLIMSLSRSKNVCPASLFSPMKLLSASPILIGLALCLPSGATQSAPVLPTVLSSEMRTNIVRVRAVVRRGGAIVGPRGGAVVRRGTAVVGPRGNAAVRRTTVVRPGYAGGGVRWARPGRYYWPRGGAIAAGAAIGFVTAATAAAWAGAAPAPGMCWYYTDPSRTQGFWDYCQ